MTSLRTPESGMASPSIQGSAASGANPHWEEVQVLDLSHQELGYPINRDDLFTTLRGTVNVQTLLLVGNHIRSLQSIWLPCLVTLDLSHNEVTSFAELPKSPVLRTLNLSQNKIPPTAAAVKHLKRYKRLERLSLRGNPAAFSPDYQKL